MKHGFFLDKERELQEVREQAERLCYLDRDVPDMVFKPELGHYGFMSFQWVERNDFGNLLYAISKKFGDKNLYGLLDNPLRFKQDWECYSAFHLGPGWDPDTYKQMRNFPLGPLKEPFFRAEQIYYWTVTGFFFGDTERWVIYYDRDSMITIFAAKDDVNETHIEWPELPPHMWLDRVNARDQIIAFSSNDSPYKERRDLLLKNYGLLDA